MLIASSYLSKSDLGLHDPKVLYEIVFIQERRKEKV